jgi:hypothetical protein
MSRGDGEFDLIGGSVNITNSINPLPVVNATASNQAVNLGQAFTQLVPTASGNITPISLNTVVIPTPSSAATLTLEPGTVIGQKVRIYSWSNYQITVSSNVASGSPYFAMPDGSTIYSFALPLELGAFFEGVWDGVNWRCATAGPIVSPMNNNQVLTPASGNTYTISNSFIAPCNGYILAASTINVGGAAEPVGCTNSISINGTKYGSDITANSATNWGAAAVSAGTACTVTSTLVAGSSSGTFTSLSQTVMSIFITNP